MTTLQTLRRLAVLEGRSHAPDGAGGTAENWMALGRHRVALSPAAPREIFEADQEASRLTHRITVRFAAEDASARPNPDQRFRIGSRLFNIRAVFDLDGRARYLTCLCVEGEPA